MRLPPLPTIREIIQLYKLRATKHLSQNFLLNTQIIRKIVKAPGAGAMKGCHVCEVGPGPGGITRSILEAKAEKVIVVEKDIRFIKGLQLLNEASDGKVQIHHGDILNFDMTNIFPVELAKPWEGHLPKLHIIGNLPFNVSTPLIIKWLELISEQKGAWSYGRVRLTLTFQKEVCERIVAPINDNQRSRLSIMCQYLTHAKYVYTIPGKAFVPPPDVDVGVVCLVPKIEPDIKLPFKVIEKVVRHVFHYRQKFCKHGVKTLFPPDREIELTERMFKDSAVVSSTRPMKLSMDEFKRLCLVYNDLCDENPGLFDYDYRSKEGVEERRQFRKENQLEKLETEEEQLDIL